MIDVVNNMRAIAIAIGLRGMHDVAATLGTTLQLPQSFSQHHTHAHT